MLGPSTLTFGLLACSLLCPTNGGTTLFQVIEESYFPIWLNWWIMAIELKSFPAGWDLHIACLGGNVDRLVRKVHAPGCTRTYDKYDPKRVFFAKWTAAVEALRLGNNLLAADVDALLIRNPLERLRTHESWDLISSRDHGPSQLFMAGNWGSARFCTGLIYFKYSQEVLELAELSLKRCDKYGDDQISFNNVMARSGLAWLSSLAQIKPSQEVDRAGYLPWMHQTDPDFLAFDSDGANASHAQQLAAADALLTDPALRPAGIGSASPVNMSVLLLGHDRVIRYCSEPQKRGPAWLEALTPKALSREKRARISVLHCFVMTGPLKGNQKRNLKQQVWMKLRLWLLVSGAERHLRSPQGTFQRSNLLLPDSPETQAMVGALRSNDLVKLMRRQWFDE
jgi:hypothetical protein